jgi:hypothetical protein
LAQSLMRFEDIFDIVLGDADPIVFHVDRANFVTDMTGHRRDI